MRYLVLGVLPVLLAADFPAADKLPANKELPDPLVMMDGAKVKSAAEWQKKRRPELKQLFQHYMYGWLPAATKLKATVERADAEALGGKAILREVSLGLGKDGKGPKIHLLLVIPRERKGLAPVFVGMNFEGNHALLDDPKIRLPEAWMYPRKDRGVKDNKATEAGRGKAKEVWAIDQAIARGYAIATFYSGDVDPDRKEERGGMKPLIDKDNKAGTIAAWAWGYHRVVDFLQDVAEIDSQRICVVGHSRLGKTALLAAAMDERIALAIPHQAGCGGTGPSRDWVRKEGDKVETVARINTAFPHWFNGEFKKFNDEPARLPFDQHCLAALVAPRPLLYTNAVEDAWANPTGQFEMLKAADPVYKLLKAGGLESTEMPKVGELSAGKLGYYIRAGVHSMTRADWKVFLDYADKHLPAPEAREAKKATKKILLIAQGPDGHAAKTHEYVGGHRVLAELLKKVAEVQTMTVSADGKWPEGPELIDRVDGVVLFLAEGAKWVSEDEKRLAALKRLQARGGGLTTLHWAMGAREAGPIKEFVALFGGCHGGPDRKYKVLETDVLVRGTHPVTRGLKDFTIKDEFYYSLKFPKANDAPKMTPLVRVKIDDEEHVVAWAAEAGKSRAFGFSGLHFHENWKRPEYRRLVAQGVLWSVGATVPKEGMDVEIEEKVLRLR